MADDPTRWSHSTGEMEAAQERVDQANNGAVGEATVAMSANATDLFSTISSGESAKKRREELQLLREARIREQEAAREAEAASEEEAAGEEEEEMVAMKAREAELEGDAEIEE